MCRASCLFPPHSSFSAVTGAVDTNSSCHHKGGFMYEGSALGTAVSTLTLATNLAATTLTAYKAW